MFLKQELDSLFNEMAIFQMFYVLLGWPVILESTSYVLLIMSMLLYFGISTSCQTSILSGKMRLHSCPILRKL